MGGGSLLGLASVKTFEKGRKSLILDVKDFVGIGGQK